MRLRLLDLDGSVLAQPSLRRRASGDGAQVIAFGGEGARLRLWAYRTDMANFARAVADRGPPPGRGAEVTFIGSGDFHHLTASLLARMPGPLSIVHFDNHPDWGTWPPAYHCGSWVNRALDLPQVAKIITIGPTAPGTTWPQFKGANLHALASRRLELHPWRLPPSRVMGGPVDPGAGHRRIGRAIHWNNLAGRDWTGFIESLAARLPTTNVYVTIDKDVLCGSEAVTNWNQGEMRLDHIVSALKALAARRRIVGVDVCGEFAPPHFPNLAKRMLARVDQPRPPCAPDLALNDAANARLLDVLEELDV